MLRPGVGGVSQLVVRLQTIAAAFRIVPPCFCSQIQHLEVSFRPTPSLPRIVEKFTRERLEKLLDGVDSLLLAIFSRSTDQLTLDLIDLATYEAQFVAASLAKAATTGVRFDADLPGATAVRVAVLSKPLSVRGTDGGKLINPFIRDWTAAERTRTTGTIRQGFFKGQTNFQIIQKSRATAVLKYADGILASTDLSAATVVRTATSTSPARRG